MAGRHLLPWQPPLQQRMPQSYQQHWLSQVIKRWSILQGANGLINAP